MRRSRLAGVVVVGLLVAGCSDPTEEEQLADRLESEYELAPEVADCVADQVFERFTPDQITTLREAEGREDLSEDMLTRLQAALTPCASAGS